MTTVVEPGEWDSFGPERHQEFLDHFWQKRPLLIRNAFPDWEPLVTPDQLAGLACAEDVESRIITEEIGLGTEEQEGTLWELDHGPFEEELFEELGDSHWTLLVQEVSRHIPEVSDLLHHPAFSFAPTWRMDDIMISYAPKDGSIGAHVDNYDVFLLQGSGTREWSIETTLLPGEEEAARLLPDLDVRVLRGWAPDRAWVLRPGDMLYLPPRVPHRGVSLDDQCMTYSVGFRAPGERELLALFVDHVGQRLVSEHALVGDPDLQLQANPGQVAPAAVARCRAVVRDAVLRGLEEPGVFERWLGKLVSQTRHEHFGYPFPWAAAHAAVPYRWESPRAFVDDFARAAAAGEAGPVLYRAEGLKFVYLDEETPPPGVPAAGQGAGGEEEEEAGGAAGEEGELVAAGLELEEGGEDGSEGGEELGAELVGSEVDEVDAEVDLGGLAGPGVLLCVDGRAYPLPRAAAGLAEAVCARHRMAPGAFAPLWARLGAQDPLVCEFTKQLLADLVDSGALYPAED